jgi:hypothetical protein
LRDTLSAGVSSLIIITTLYIRNFAVSDVQEEKFLFPECEKRVPGSMVQNVEQHQLFHEGFEAMETYFRQVQKTPSLYDGEKVLSIIERFGNVFCRHLQEEIGTLERSKLVAIFPVEAEFVKVWKEMMDWIISTSSKLTSMPWVLYSIFQWSNGRLFHTMKRRLRRGF